MASASQTHSPSLLREVSMAVNPIWSHLVYEFEEGDQSCGRSSKLLAGMKPDKKGKKPPPGQLRLFWDEVDMGNEEIIGVATKFVKANCYSPNPKMF